MDEIRGSVGKPLHDLSRDLERLPVRYGGLGLTSPIDIAPHAFLASRACASRVLRQRPGLNIPAQFRSDFNTKPQDTTTARAASSNPGTASTLSTSVAPTRATDVSTIPPQRSLVDTFVHQRYHNKVLDTIHVPQLRAQDQHPTNSSAKSLVSFTERGSKLTRQIFDSSCPGASDGAMLFSNEQLSIAVARWTMLVTIEDDDCTCTLCGEKLPSQEQLKTHKMHCTRKRQVQRHNSFRDAVATMINADIRSRHLDKKYYVTRESGIGKKPVAKSSTSFSDIRSDITIPAGSIQGVGQANETQEADFAVSTVFRCIQG